MYSKRPVSSRKLGFVRHRPTAQLVQLIAAKINERSKSGALVARVVAPAPALFPTLSDSIIR